MSELFICYLMFILFSSIRKNHSINRTKQRALNALPFIVINFLNVLVKYSSFKRSRDNVVGIVTRYGLDGPGIESRWGRDFSAPVQTGSEAHPASYTMGTGPFPGVKQPGRGVNHPPHLSPRLKKE